VSAEACGWCGGTRSGGCFAATEAPDGGAAAATLAHIRLPLPCSPLGWPGEHGQQLHSVCRRQLHGGVLLVRWPPV